MTKQLLYNILVDYSTNSSGHRATECTSLKKSDFEKRFQVWMDISFLTYSLWHRSLCRLGWNRKEKRRRFGKEKGRAAFRDQFRLWY
jgi:hypothetical protein